MCMLSKVLKRMCWDGWFSTHTQHLDVKAVCTEDQLNCRISRLKCSKECVCVCFRVSVGLAQRCMLVRALVPARRTHSRIRAKKAQHVTKCAGKAWNSKSAVHTMKTTEFHVLHHLQASQHTMMRPLLCNEWQKGQEHNIEYFCTVLQLSCNYEELVQRIWAFW